MELESLLELNLDLVVVDIDHFKLINDTQGHALGDEVLAAVGEALKAGTRVEDLVSRYGGEEFVIVFDHCTLDQGKLKAEKLRESLAKLKPAGTDITASFGVSSLETEREEDFATLFERADRAVYEAKDLGRNQVRVA